MNDPFYEIAKERALAVMCQVYDPFHDDNHVLEVEHTASLIYRALEKRIRDNANLDLIKLACLYHDTSRKVIKTNILLQPFLDGYFSGKIAYKKLVEVGYPKQQAIEVKKIINDHESILGLVKRNPDTNCYIFSDADCIEGYSVKRIDRALKRFQRREFSKLLLNIYVIGLVYLHNNKPPIYNFQISKQIHSDYVKRLKRYLIDKRDFIRGLLFKPVYIYLYKADFLN